MKESIIRTLCENKELGNPNVFVKFFMLRFPNESDKIHSYCNEWIDIFMSGDPKRYMDQDSQKCYKKALSLY